MGHTNIPWHESHQMGQRIMPGPVRRNPRRGPRPPLHRSGGPLHRRPAQRRGLPAAGPGDPAGVRGRVLRGGRRQVPKPGLTHANVKQMGRDGPHQSIVLRSAVFAWTGSVAAGQLPLRLRRQQLPPGWGRQHFERSAL